MLKNEEDIFIGKRVREARTSKGYSQAKLAEEFSLSAQQVQKLEAGINRISAKMLYKLSRLCDQPLDWFLQDLDKECLKPNIVPDDSRFTVRAMHYFSQLQNKKQQRKALRIMKVLLEEE